MSTFVQAASARIASTLAVEVTPTLDQQVKLATANYFGKIASCDKLLKIGIFLDGTNNNRQCDKLDNLGNQVIQLNDRTEVDSVLSTLYETMPKAFAEPRPSSLYQQTSQTLLHFDQQQIHDHQLRLRQVAALLAIPQFDQRPDIHYEN